MAHYRINRISEEIRKEVSDIIRNAVKDPRIAELSSVVKTEVTGDLRYAKIYVSVLGDEVTGKSTLEGLKKAAGFIRRELGKRLDIRHTPELQFVLDRSIEYSIEISQKLNELNLGQENKDDI
ncbi:MAG: 30S ribosome-binding factor RbfA [Caldicoprobacterales bacterium]|jgi:ribosome-binding factor A|nr:30S ribosome-binding factor RbfA [Clostridiales bacterium]